MFNFRVSDPNDNFTLNVLNASGNYSLQRISREEFAFNWKLDYITNDPLIFIANDSSGAASFFSPIIEVCACTNGGYCTSAGISTTNATITMRCVCPKGQPVKIINY